MLKFTARCHLAVLFLAALVPFSGISALASTATATVGQTVTFSVTASGTAPFAYQWYKAGATLAGATGASYSISNVQTTSAGAYYAVVTNSIGSTMSDTGTLTVTAVSSAPVFTTQPTGATVSTGSSVTFAAVVSGSPAPTYQWKLNGVAISGATSASLTIPNAQSANAGNYNVVATNSVGSVTSSTANLTVNVVTSAPVFTTQPVGATLTAGTSVTFTAAASGSPTPTYQWKLNGVVISGATSASLTIANAQPTNAGNYNVVATNSVGSVTSSTANLTVNVVTSAPVFTTQPASQTVTAGTTVTFTAAASGSPTPTYQWKLNGANVSGATSASLTLANVQSANAGNYNVIATNSVGSVTSSTANLTVNPVTTAPVFTTQPASQTVTAGTTVTFTAAATGSPAPSYQWKLNGVSISGATSASLTISSVQSANAGNYNVIATNSVGSVTSSTANLTVNPVTTAPAMTTQPASQTVLAGTTVTFTAAANGSPTPTYQWKLNGVSISGATSASLTLANVQSANAGNYNVVATNSVGSVMSSTANLTVNPVTTAPIMTTQPVSQTVLAGTTVTFTTAASGSPVPTYQWKLNGVSISGATGASLTLANVQSASAGNYNIVATNSVGSVTSSTANLTVNPVTTVPVMTTQPASQTVLAGTTVTFTAAASGSPTPTYQWKLNGVSISGATSASLTIPSVQSANAGNYNVVATNSVGSVTSSTANLTVNPVTAVPVITTQPASQTVTAGTTVTFTAAASGSPAPTFQWKLNGAAISGATNASLTIANAQTANAGGYTVTATNSVGSVVSGSATLAIKASAKSLAVHCDFNGDGQSDILWQNAITGEISVWLMAGTTVSKVVSLGVFSTDWQIGGTGDFNGNGQTDIVLQNRATGECVIWLMTGTNISSVVSLGIVAPNWQLSGTGDFNADGQWDILWQNVATGEGSVWLMAGTTVGSVVSLGIVSTDWQLAGSGDFNGDGQSDLLWQNLVTGARTIWLMSGVNATSKPALGTFQVTTDWVIGGTGDFNGDGKSDVLWQDTVTGDCGVWLMSGTTLSSIVPLGTVSTALIMRN